MLCAGELRVGLVWEGGVSPSVVMLSDASGHYKPDGRVCLWRVCERLRELGVPVGENEEGLVWGFTSSWGLGWVPPFYTRGRKTEGVTRREYERKKREEV